MCRSAALVFFITNFYFFQKNVKFGLLQSSLTFTWCPPPLTHEIIHWGESYTIFSLYCPVNLVQSNLYLCARLFSAYLYYAASSSKFYGEYFSRLWYEAKIKIKDDTQSNHAVLFHLNYCRLNYGSFELLFISTTACGTTWVNILLNLNYFFSSLTIFIWTIKILLMK